MENQDYDRVYIGERYVPVFAEPAEWTSTREYEPLTIVLNQGNSFTSRQYVPIGIDINNTEYWAETGNFNAQVEQYKQEVLTYNDRISNIENISDVVIENYEDDYALINVIKIPKSKYGIAMELNSGNPSVSENLKNFVLNNKPFLAINFTNGSSFIYNNTVYGNGDYAGAISDCFYGIKQNENDFSIVQGDGITRYNDLVSEFECGAFSSQAVVINGTPITIPNVTLYNEHHPRRFLAWNDDYWFVGTVIARIGTKIGYTLTQLRNFCVNKNYENVAVLDGGGSVQTIFGEPYNKITPTIDSNRSLRPAYYCITFRNN